MFKKFLYILRTLQHLKFIFPNFKFHIDVRIIMFDEFRFTNNDYGRKIIRNDSSTEWISQVWYDRTNEFYQRAGAFAFSLSGNQVKTSTYKTENG